jgi:hypothetical protein
VTVTWPDGEEGPPMRLEANGFAMIEREADAPRPWTPSVEDR